MSVSSPIEYQHVTKAFGANAVLKDINFTAPAGKATCIIGPSGSGKSTLLRCTNLLEVPDGGQIMFGDTVIDKSVKDVDKIRARMGMVFQSFALYPNMSAAENVMFALTRVRRLGKDEAHTVATDKLDLVGLAGLGDRRPHQLSGGQQQRVAIARALAMEPDAMLFDEATSALDPELVQEVLAVIRSLAQSGMTMIMVTHEMNFARDVADQVAFLDRGELVEHGPPGELLVDPQTPRLRRFLGRLL